MHRPCIKRTLVISLLISFQTNSPLYTSCPKYLEKDKDPPFNILQPKNRPQPLELRVRLRRCWGEKGGVESHLHYTRRGMRQTILHHCRMRHLRQQKRRENACTKALVFTVKASCGLYLDWEDRGGWLVPQFLLQVLTFLSLPKTIFWTAATSMLIVKTNSSLKLKLFLIIFHF